MLSLERLYALHPDRSGAIGTPELSRIRELIRLVPPPLSEELSDLPLALNQELAEISLIHRRRMITTAVRQEQIYLRVVIGRAGHHLVMLISESTDE
jgi:hypothetical protein